MIKKFPFYIQTTVILAGLTLLVYVISILQNILIPLTFALILSILLNPLVDKLVALRIPKVPAILLAVVIGLLVFTGIAYFLSSQIMNFGHELPQLNQRISEFSGQAQQWLQQKINIRIETQQKFLHEATAQLKPIMERMAGTLFGTILMAFLVPIYIILILYYKNLILNFVFELFAERHSEEVGKVLMGSKLAVQSYMMGLLIEGAIVASLNSLALLILGVKYAFLLGVLGAIVNVLPFIGGVLSTLLPLFVATITKGGISTQVGIVILYVLIQFADNHFLIPWVVSSRVKLNALISLIVVWLGGAVWGLGGMFLSIPIIGILKIVLDRIPGLQPWGKLLGNELPLRPRGRFLLRGKATGKVSSDDKSGNKK